MSGNTDGKEDDRQQAVECTYLVMAAGHAILQALAHDVAVPCAGAGVQQLVQQHLSVGYSAQHCGAGNDI